jgi:sulfide:quinone oxidoreductase
MGHATRLASHRGLRVLIAGGGVAGVETMLAVRALAGDLVDVQLLSPEPHFWCRPDAVAEPFAGPRVGRFEVAAVAAAVGAHFALGELAAVDPAAQRAVTAHGGVMEYDALVVACGARPVAAVAGALTFRGPADADALAEVLADLDTGAAESIVFALPPGRVRPLPLYELALQTAARDVEVSLVTPERAPLAVLGAAASATVRALLAAYGVTVYPRSVATAFRKGRLELAGGAVVEADRAVASRGSPGARSTASRTTPTASSRRTTTVAFAAFRTSTPRETSRASPSSTAESPPSRPTRSPERSPREPAPRSRRRRSSRSCAPRS